MSDDTTVLGGYVAGEEAEGWINQFLDFDGLPINITGWEVRLSFKVNGGPQEIRVGTVEDGPAGKARYDWVDPDLATPGVMAGELVVTNPADTQKYARRFVMRLKTPLGGTLP